MSKNEAFKGGYKDSKNDIRYSVSDQGGRYSVIASSPGTYGAVSTADFDYDENTGQQEVVPGSLDIHPEHEGKDVGRGMRRAAQLKADARR